MPLDPSPFLRAILEQRWLEPPLLHSFLSGNRDRRPDLSRMHLRVQDGLGRTMKLTLGRGLAPARVRADEFHAALPLHAPKTIFFLPGTEADTWAQTWIEGPSIERPIASLEAAIQTILALENLETGLAATTELSSDAAWEVEFAARSKQSLDLPCWTPAEKAWLDRSVLPWLRTALRPSSATRRWSNGDYLSNNIKLSPTGPVLLDFEYGGKTHFFAEDQIRFQQLSPVAQLHPGLFNERWPEATPAWEIFFLLRQLALEHEVNTPEYLAREIPRRKAHLRFAAEAAGLDGSPWSVAAQPPPPEFAQETMQLFWKAGEGWSENSSRRAIIRRGSPQFVAFRLPSETRALRLDPVATHRCAVIGGIRAVQRNGTSHDCAEGVVAVGADLKRSSEGLLVSPHASDPQLFFSLPPAATWLVVEVRVAES